MEGATSGEQSWKGGGVRDVGLLTVERGCGKKNFLGGFVEKRSTFFREAKESLLHTKHRKGVGSGTFYSLVKRKSSSRKGNGGEGRGEQASHKYLPV